MNPRKSPCLVIAPLVGAVLAAFAAASRADVVTDWNERSAQIIAEARIGTPPAVRVMALVQTAAYEAARDAASMAQSSAQAVEAAIAAAHRTVFVQVLPAQRALVDAAFQAAVAALPEDVQRAQHVALGDKAAQRVLAARADEMPRTPDTVRPHTTPGVWVPTVAPAAAQWSQRKPWMLRSADQFRPGPPPALTSAQWARDYDEIKAHGSRGSTVRKAEQTDIGRFWDFSLPAVYHGVVRSIALGPGRDVLGNARLFAVATQAMDDALIAVFDAKYHYNFWRPVTAIRNGDVDGHDRTERDAGWTPLIDTPMHPEYPCAHCTLASTVSAVLAAEAGGAPLPVLSTSSPTAKNAVRRWNNLDEFTREVALARIVGGVHYRFSTEAGQSLGTQIGEWVANRARVADE